MHAQLPLNVSLRDSSSFDNFYAPRNAETVARLTAVVAKGENGRPVYLWGERGSGKSHLLQAVCHLAAAHEVTAAYVPLGRLKRLPPGPLENLETAPLVCVDDVDAIAGRRDWETALFTLSDRLREVGGVLIASGSATPGGLGLGMPELVSRLARGLIYHLQVLDDGEKLIALRLRARNRGFEIPDEVARYILSRYRRDTGALFTLLNRIDRASLAQQRRITIPLVRGLIAKRG